MKVKIPSRSGISEASDFIVGVTNGILFHYTFNNCSVSIFPFQINIYWNTPLDSIVSNRMTNGIFMAEHYHRKRKYFPGKLFIQNSWAELFCGIRNMYSYSATGVNIEAARRLCIWIHAISLLISPLDDGLCITELLNCWRLFARQKGDVLENHSS